jgi:hypothetical protein
MENRAPCHVRLVGVIVKGKNLHQTNFASTVAEADVMVLCPLVYSGKEGVCRKAPISYQATY